MPSSAKYSLEARAYVIVITSSVLMIRLLLVLHICNHVIPLLMLPKFVGKFMYGIKAVCETKYFTSSHL